MITTSILITFFFFFNDTATTEIYTLSLHDALPIYRERHRPGHRHAAPGHPGRSEEHTSELQSRENLVCRLLLEKKKRHESPRVVITNSLYRRVLVFVFYIL